MKLDASGWGLPAGARSESRVKQLAQHHRDLDPGDVQSEAQMRTPSAERHVGIWIAADVETVRIGEDLLVAVARPVEDHHLVPGCDRLCAKSVSAIAVRRKCTTGEV